MLRRVGWILVEDVPKDLVEDVPKEKMWADLAPIFKTRAEAREWKKKNFPCGSPYVKIMRVMQDEHR